MPKVLNAFDFDNTLVVSTARVIVKRPNGEVKYLTPHEYARYRKSDGETYDFSEFDDVKNAVPIPKYIHLLRQSIDNPDTDTVIITARGPGSERNLAKYLKSIGITHGVRIKTLQSGKGSAKSKYIENRINQSGYSTVNFYDDAESNIEAVNSLKNRVGDKVKINTHLVPEKDYQPLIDKSLKKADQKRELDKIPKYPSILKPEPKFDIIDHLKQRGVDPSLITVHIDKENGIATFPLYNLSGQMVGIQRYNPRGSKKEKIDTSKMKYFTYISKEGRGKKLAVWGTENIDKNNPNLYVTEGIFDAIKLVNAGLPAIATLSNDPKQLKSWFKSLGKRIIAITDNDNAGQKLSKLADESYTVPGGFKDLGDMNPEQVNKFLSTIGHTPQKSKPRGQGRLASILTQRLKNPETGNMILIKTALGYPKSHPMYRLAIATVKRGMGERAIDQWGGADQPKLPKRAPKKPQKPNGWDAGWGN